MQCGSKLRVGAGGANVRRQKARRIQGRAPATNGGKGKAEEIKTSGYTRAPRLGPAGSELPFEVRTFARKTKAGQDRCRSCPALQERTKKN
jgi:hypothetical protein